MSRLPSIHIAQVQAVSKAMQHLPRKETSAAPPAPQHYRALAAEKEASAALLLKQYEARCSKNPHTAFTADTCALWEGHFALLQQARDLRRIADECEPAAIAQINTSTHRVTASA